MDGGRDGGLVAWLIDVVAASLLGAACAFAGVRLGTSVTGWAVGCAAMLLAFGGLRLVQPEPRSFRLPVLVLDPPIRGDCPDDRQIAGPEPLLLNDVLAAVDSDARVVRLFPRQPIPTAGELAQRIETHLARQEVPPGPAAEVVHLQADASMALREALADLRRSLNQGRTAS